MNDSVYDDISDIFSDDLEELDDIDGIESFNPDLISESDYYDLEDDTEDKSLDEKFFDEFILPDTSETSPKIEKSEEKEKPAEPLDYNGIDPYNVTVIDQHTNRYKGIKYAVDVKNPNANLEYGIENIWNEKTGDRDEIDLVEFGKYFFKYIRLKDPDGKKTNYYSIFRHMDDGEWACMHGLLSTRYYIVSLEKFLKKLREKVTFLEEPVIYTADRFSIMAKVKNKLNVNHLFDDDNVKIIFTILTGCPVSTYNNLNTSINIMLTNSYNGLRSLSCDYSISMSCEWDHKNINMHDFFTMCARTYRVKHLTKIDYISTEIFEIENEISGCINRLKSVVTNLDKYSKKIGISFPKHSKETFNRLWDGCIGDFRNLYYLLICASIVLSNNYSCITHTKLKCTINPIISRALRELEK